MIVGAHFAPHYSNNFEYQRVATLPAGVKVQSEQEIVLV